MTVLCNLRPPSELEGPDATTPWVCKEPGAYGGTEIFLDTKMLDALKTCKGEKHTLGSISAQERRQRLMQSSATCSVF